MKLALTALLASFSVVYADPYTCQDAEWECRYPSAYSLNCFSGCCEDFRLSAAFLYWNISDEPFEFLIEKKAIRNTETEISDQLLSFKENCRGVDFGYDPGFRIGLGTTLPCCCCLDLDFYWTHYYVHGKKNVLIQGASDPVYRSFCLLQVPEIGCALESNQTAHFCGTAKFRYDVLDLEVGKWCCLCDCISFRPFFGLRYVDIEDKSRVEFDFNDSLTSFHVSNGNAKSSDAFRGLGIRGGFGVEYDCCYCLKAYGNIAGSFAWGKTHSSFSFEALDDEWNPCARTACRRNAGRAFLDGAIGIEYSTCICGCYPLTIDVAWEQNYLFDIKRCHSEKDIFSLSEASEHSCGSEDLVLSGLTLTVQLDF
ncbi:MAG: Lpg1974 family pore-forming outer membrane protein [Parachlamydiaceae bacterium]